MEIFFIPLPVTWRHQVALNRIFFDGGGGKRRRRGEGSGGFSLVFSSPLSSSLSLHPSPFTHESAVRGLGRLLCEKIDCVPRKIQQTSALPRSCPTFLAAMILHNIIARMNATLHRSPLGRGVRSIGDNSPLRVSIAGIEPFIEEEEGRSRRGGGMRKRGGEEEKDKKRNRKSALREVALRKLFQQHFRFSN